MGAQSHKKAEKRHPKNEGIFRVAGVILTAQTQRTGSFGRRPSAERREEKRKKARSADGGRRAKTEGFTVSFAQTGVPCVDDAGKPKKRRYRQGVKTKRDGTKRWKNGNRSSRRPQAARRGAR